MFFIQWPCDCCGSDEHDYWECQWYVKPELIHPLVAESDGGGLCPEQHEGTLIDGRYFYFRTRHGESSLTVSRRPKTQDQFWGDYLALLHGDGCPNAQDGTLTNCSTWDDSKGIQNPYDCQLVFIDMHRAFLDVSETAHGGWGHTQEQNDFRNEAFSKLMDMING